MDVSTPTSLKSALQKVSPTKLQIVILIRN